MDVEPLGDEGARPRMAPDPGSGFLDSTREMTRATEVVEEYVLRRAQRMLLVLREIISF